MTTPPSPTDAGGIPGRRLAMAVLLIANFMNLIDVTIVNVALPSLQASMGATSTQIEWVVAAYIFTFALWLIPAGRLGDLYGRRRLFLIGVAVFTLASALCGLAPSIHALVWARVLQGFGGALMTPQTLALVPVLFPPKERGGVFALFGLTAGMAAVTGPILGGSLIGADIFGLEWRPIFLVNIPVGLFALFMARRHVPSVPGHPALGVDFVGMALAGLSLLFLLVPLIEGRALGWPAWAFGMMAASLPLAAGFVLWQRRQAARSRPELLPIALLSRPSFLVGGGMAALFFSGVPGFFFVLALYLQVGHGLTPLQSGLTTLPFSIGVLCASIVSGRLGSRQLRLRVAVGATLIAASLFALREVALYGEAIVRLHYWIPLFVAGCGLGTAVSPLFQTALADVPHRDAGSASGAIQAIQQVGGAFGVAIMGELFFARLAGAGADPGHAGFAAALTLAMIYATAAFALIALTSALLPRADPGADGLAPAPQPLD